MTVSEKKTGFTLIELLIAIALMVLIVGALDQVAARVLSTYRAVQAGQDLFPQARYALERMVTFVQESDYIDVPNTKKLTVSERLSDQYTNKTSPPIYNVDGDSKPDADDDADGLINVGSGVPAELITFRLDETDATNGRLMEQMPNYGTSQTGDVDPNAERIICEHVTVFSCRRLMRPDGTFSGIVEIVLTLQQGSKTVKLQTTAKARWVD